MGPKPNEGVRAPGDLEVSVEVVEAGRSRVLGWIGGAAPLGSVSSYEPSGPEMYLFGWRAGTGPAVWRQRLGVRIDGGTVRDLGSVGFEPVADLNDGPCELTLHRRIGEPLHLRLRAVRLG